jgi:hypothetical protein
MTLPESRGVITGLRRPGLLSGLVSASRVAVVVFALLVFPSWAGESFAVLMFARAGFRAPTMSPAGDISRVM